MTKKIKTETLPPPASDHVEPTPAASHPALVGSIGVRAEPTETHQPSPTELASDALEHATGLLVRAQHSDFSSTRHRAMTLIAEARALL